MNPATSNAARPFLVRPGDLFAPPPYRVETAVFNGFVIDSSYPQLSALLEEQLGAITGGECQFLALVPAVIITYISIARSFSLAAGKSQAGYYLEQDLMLWLLVAQLRRGSIVPERIGFYAPFVWVGHPAALVEGREGFGYPKGFGSLSIPQPGDQQLYKCDAYTFPGDPTAEVGLSPVNEVQQRTGSQTATEASTTPTAEDELGERWTTSDQARRAILASLVDTPTAHQFSPAHAPINLSREFAVSPQQNFLLRQFRSASDPATAAYQEIIAAPFAETTFHGGGIRQGEWIAEFPTLPAFDLAAKLGVQSQSRVRLAYQVTLDTTLAPAATVWSSTAPTPPAIRATASEFVRAVVARLQVIISDLQGRRQTI